MMVKNDCCLNCVQGEIACFCLSHSGDWLGCRNHCHTGCDNVLHALDLLIGPVSNLYEEGHLLRNSFIVNCVSRDVRGK